MLNNTEHDNVNEAFKNYYNKYILKV